MSSLNDIRKTVSESTPVLAVVGATDAAFRRARYLIDNASTVQAEVESRVTKLQERVEKAVADFDAKQLQTKVADRLDPKALQASAQQVPALAVARALELAGRAEAGYEGFAERGKVVVERVRSQKATQDLIKQGKATVSRTKAAVTTARKAVDETAGAALGVVRTGRSEADAAAAETVEAAEDAVTTAQEAVETAAETAAATTKVSAKKAAPTVRKSSSATRAAAKGVTTGARRSASAAGKPGDD